MSLQEPGQADALVLRVAAGASRLSTTGDYGSCGGQQAEQDGRQRASSGLSHRRQLIVKPSFLTALFYPHYHEGSEEEQRLFDATRRGRVAKFIHRRGVQIALLCLLTLDVCVVITEILLQSHKQCVVSVADGCPSNGLVVIGGDTYRPRDAKCSLTVRNELPAQLHDIEVVLRWVSRTILFVFAIELVTLFCCLLGRFFTRLYVLDSIVIAASLVLDFTLSEEAGAQQELLVMFRAWRFARILHGVGLTVHDVDAEEMEQQRMTLEGRLHVLDAEVARLKRENDGLRRKE